MVEFIIVIAITTAILVGGDALYGRYSEKKTDRELKELFEARRRLGR